MGDRGVRSVALEAEYGPNFFFFFLPCLTSLGTALRLSRGKAAVLLLQHKEQTGEFRSASQSSEREREQASERASSVDRSASNSRAAAGRERNEETSHSNTGHQVLPDHLPSVQKSVGGQRPLGSLG